MALIATLRRILNDTPGTATDIDYNFQTLEDYVNAELIHRDGSVAMQAPLVGVDAVNDNELVTKRQLAAGIPVGTIIDWAGDENDPGVDIPEGWAVCNGQTQSATDPEWAPLWAVIGQRYGGAGNNFQLPNLQMRMAIGADGTNRPAATGGSLNVAQHTHTATFTGTALGNHKHTMPSHAHGRGDMHVNISHDHANISGVFGTRGQPAGWVQTGETGVLFGNNDQVNFALGGALVSASPNNWFNRTIDIPALGNTDKVVEGSTASVDPGDTNNASAGTPAGTVAVTQTGDANNNRPPYIVLNKLIKK